MKKLFIVSRILWIVFLFSAFSSKATHIIGGDIIVKYLSPNNFEVTLTFYRDCNIGNADFDLSVTLGVFDKVTNAMQQQPIFNLLTRDTLALGDTCYSPPGLCVERGIYQGTINLPNNPNGYYLSWHRCCRNSLINNIVNPLASGYVFYVEVPNPVLQNSSPVFASYPDAYMCANYPNIENFSATDADGDSLVYSLSVPLDCDPTTGCSANPIPPPSPAPYGTITWQAPYSFANILGDPAMAVNNQTGILTTIPPTLGVFVFCVKVEEYRNSVKIGEIRRDVQYATLTCGVPQIQITGPNPLCIGNSTTLTVTGGTSYSWNTGATSSSIIVTPTATGTYTYSVSTQYGNLSNPNCLVFADTVLTVNPAAVATAVAADDTICIGTNTTLTATGGGTYLWSPGGQTTDTAVVSPSVITTYTVLVTNNFGCSTTASVTVVPVPVPAVSVSPADTICIGDSAFLSASSPMPNVTYSWVPGTGLSCSNCPNTWASPGFSNTYTVYVIAGNGCDNSATISLTVGPIPFISAIAGTTICTGDSIQLTSNTSNGVTPYTYYWIPPNALNNPNLQNPMAGPLTSTNYTVIVTDANGCTDDTTTSVQVQTIPSISLTDLTPDLTCEGYVISFEANMSSNGQYVFWDFGDGTTPITLYPLPPPANPNIVPPPHPYPFNGTYTVTAVVYNPPCKDTLDTVLVVADMANFLLIEAANVFTPNGDGVNDCFHPAFIAPVGSPISPDTLETLSECVEMEIYDRWGIKMFETNINDIPDCMDKQNVLVKGWDGKTRQGKDANEGTYFYIAKFGEITLKGYITLLRKKN